MKILIFASCSKTKSLKYPHQPNCDEILSKEMREQFLQRFPEKRTAKELYRGSLNISLNSAVRQLREFFDVSYYIISAGFGIINELDKVPPYECSFSDMSNEKIIERAKQLHIPEDFKEIIQREEPDFIYLALGKNYLLSVGEWDIDLPCKTIAFYPSNSEQVITLPADHIAVKEASSIGGLPIHGVIGYKGDLLLLTTRYLKNQKDPAKALIEILNDPEDLIYTLNSIRDHGY
ncbi:MAG: hypothetical protein EAX90_09610 [Candidatus Heimdallarchaeota archaeon]|nr:hypothetical protein [Candidatus Heimdallarchaeota archaeon]